MFDIGRKLFQALSINSDLIDSPKLNREGVPTVFPLVILILRHFVYKVLRPRFDSHHSQMQTPCLSANLNSKCTHVLFMELVID